MTIYIQCMPGTRATDADVVAVGHIFLDFLYITAAIYICLTNRICICPDGTAPWRMEVICFHSVKRT